ncbi:MAG: ABC transporter permease [Isosphaeraceae bacterium]|nr:ABC transporter permease [Isosphaeraceae bacterium]
MSTASTPAPSIELHSPIAWVGRASLNSVGYLGSAGLLAAGAMRSLFRTKGPAPALAPAVSWQLARALSMGFVLTGLIHVGLGSFLSMQSYFGGTFIDGAGAVVGVGLVRNLAPLMSGMTLAALLAARLTPELRARLRATPAGDLETLPDAGRVALPRLIAGTISGPVLALWGSVVGSLVGWAVAASLLGLSGNTFWQMFCDMLWVRDILGLVVKGMGFGFFGALFACLEGLRGPVGDEADSDPDSVQWAVFRACCLSALAILLINSSWFVLVYRAGPAFGPTLLAPPNS